MSFEYVVAGLLLLLAKYLLSMWSQIKELKGAAELLTCQS
jgi:hypothetical protein